MNTQALQKKIIDGKLIAHGPVAGWTGNEARTGLATARAAELVAFDSLERKYLALLVAGQEAKSWANGLRLRQR